MAKAPGAGAKIAMTASRRGTRTIQAAGSPVHLGEGVLHELQRWLLAEARDARKFILGDENSLRQCLPELLAHVAALREAPTIAIPPGESSKSIEVCTALWSHLAGSGAERSSVLIVLGGGVVTDVGGFVGATYMRGIRTVHLPTSLMGMVDAAIGGKNGVDLDGIKNMVGTVRQPAAVYVHIPFLRTLGKRELMNGAAEMLKHGLVLDADHWHAVRAAPWHDLDALTPLIMRSAELKCEVVSRDVQEHGERRLLNFGHSIGHALEAASWEGPHRGLLHGEAVVVGMLCESWLSWRLGLMPREDHDHIAEQLLMRYKHYPFGSSDHHRMLELMSHDKKNQDGRFRFTLLESIGKGRIDVEVTAAQAAEALDHYRLRAHDVQHHDPQA
ncbi:MAG: 3-dehydroquinate synthase [Flavobacteriales bacterium]|nr:3-dehydroquinate synthase [Flavobacteriales bacterium]